MGRSEEASPRWEGKEARLELRHRRLLAGIGQAAIVELRDDVYLARYQIEQRPGEQPDVTACLIEATVGGLSAEVLRRAAAKGDALGAFHELLGIVKASGNEHDELSGEAVLERQGFAAHSRTQAGRRSRKDHKCATFAAAYVRACERGSSSPTADTAAELDRSYAYTAKMIGQARQRGVLEATGQGKPGGQLTAYGREVVEPTAPEEAP